MASSVDSRVLAGKRILTRIFSGAPVGFTARLWDGTAIPIGNGPGPFTLVFRDPAVFRQLVLRPSTRRFGEAYVEGALDIEGDIFAAVGLANRIEALKLGLRDRIGILLELLKL